MSPFPNDMGGSVLPTAVPTAYCHCEGARATAAISKHGFSSFSEYSAAAAHSTIVEVFDSLNSKHKVNIYFYHTDSALRTWEIRGVVDAGEVGGVLGSPAEVGSFNIEFAKSGLRVVVGNPNIFSTSPWANGADPSRFGVTFNPLTQFIAPSSVTAVARNGGIYQVNPSRRLDFDGDGADDRAIYRPGIGYWAILKSSAGFLGTDFIFKQFGLPGDFPMPGDYTGMELLI